MRDRERALIWFPLPSSKRGRRTPPYGRAGTEIGPKQVDLMDSGEGERNLLTSERERERESYAGWEG